MDSPDPPGAQMKNAPGNNYSEIVEQCKQALTVIIIGADIIRTRETLSPEGKKCLQQITSQAWRIDKELKKGEEDEHNKLALQIGTSRKRL